MNKYFIVFLAVCLVSVHAFVKRDAPEAAAEPKPLDDLVKQFNEFTEQASKKIQETFKPDNIKKEFDAIVTKASKVIDDLKGKDEAPK